MAVNDGDGCICVCVCNVCGLLVMVVVLCVSDNQISEMPRISYSAQKVSPLPWQNVNGAAWRTPQLTDPLKCS